jgi:hypothetical protein
MFTIINCTSKWMEAIPLSETSAAACAKALAFPWISRFGVLKTITSDRGPQFTSNLWLKLYEMLNISHRTTTAYYPESNGTVERLHHRLKDALHACAAAATWSEELLFMLLGFRAQPREDTGLFPAEAVFGAPIVLPNEFLQTEEISFDSIITFSKTLDAPDSSLVLASSCPGSWQPSSSQSQNRFPTRQRSFCTPRTGGAFTASVPVPKTGTTKEVGPLTSSPSS